MPRKLDNKFSWKNATFMAKLSKFAYSGEKEFKKVFSKQWEDITFVSKGGTECYILTCPKNYIVVFRGTEPTSWEDIKAKEREIKSENQSELLSALSGVSVAYPALLRAEKLQKRAARVGFDWKETAPDIISHVGRVSVPIEGYENEYEL